MLKTILPLPSEAKVILHRDAECSAYNGTVDFLFYTLRMGKQRSLRKAIRWTEIRMLINAATIRKLGTLVFLTILLDCP